MGSLPLKIGKLKEKPWKKLTRALPNTPTKKVDVIKTLIKSLSPSTKRKVTSNNIVPYNIISEETIKLVVSFYEDDSISRVMPGKKDVLSAADKNGAKIEKGKWLLLDDISEVHKKYLEEYPENPNGKTKFFELRLLWVIPVNKQFQEVCKCVYHEKVGMVLWFWYGNWRL